VEKRFFPPLLRVMACFALILVCLSAVAAGPAPAQNAPNGPPKIWLQDSRPLQVTYTGAGAARASGVLEGIAQPQPVAMAQGDFNQDGINDLAVGFSSGGGSFIAIHRGNLDAFAPQSHRSFLNVTNGIFAPPFLPEAETFTVPVSPDFIVAGNFTGKGNTDLALASRGGNVLYIFAGDGMGNFTAGQTINLPGGVTTLTAGALGKSAFSNLIVGVSNPKQSFLAVYGAGQLGLTPLAVIPLSGPATTIAMGDLDGDAHPDLAVVAGGRVLIYHGATQQLQAVSLPFTVSGLALGSFVFDRDSRAQMALLTSDGSVHIAAHSSFDPRAFTQAEWQEMRQATVNGLPNPLVPAPVANESWKIVDSFASVAPFSGGQPPVLFRTRISGNSADDVMVLNGTAGQMAVISHPNLADGATTFVLGELSTRPYSGSPVTALAMRVNIDGRPGVVTVHQGEMAPRFMGPLPDPTFVVNTTNDGVFPGSCLAATPNQCTLREAIIEANATAGVDTITVPAGTYTLTIADPVTDQHNASAGELSITDGVNITGDVDINGVPTTIIQACSVNPGSAVGSTCAGAGGTGITEKPFSVNPAFNKAFDTSFTNLEIRFGHNTGTFSTDGFGGGFDWEASHTGTMTVTNCNIHDNAIEDGRGAGITATNTGGGTGNFTMSKSTVSHNVAQRKLTNSGTGGGIFFGSKTQFTITNSHIDNNQATNGFSEGGGIFIFNPGTTPISVIHGGTISGNSAITRGGGIRSTAGITIDQGTVISGNTAQEGAGLWSNLGTSAGFLSGETTTLSKVTVTGNSATGTGGANPGGGGGIKVDNSASGNFFVMSFSRLAGNTSTFGGSNLHTTNPGGAVTATNNWWGTNAASSTIGGGATVNCPTPGAGQICFDPFIVLTHTASPQKIRINQSSTLTGDMSKDNHGNTPPAGATDAEIGLPITFDTAVLGTIPEAQPETLNGSLQATATFNAGGTSGLGSAHATVDQAIVSVNSNLIASATEASTTATITTVGAHGFSTGEFVTIAGVSGVGTCAGYNGSFFAILSTPTVTTFTYTAPGGLSSCNGGLANAGIIILQPPSITKSFSPTPVALNTASTITFSITNGNVVPIDSSFTDTLPANLVVASTPSVVNNCGGTVTAPASAIHIDFANAALAVGTCAIQVNVQSAVDNTYSNSVTIDSADAGNGNTSSDTLTVINPPHMVKAFGAATIPLNGTTSLTFTIDSNNNQNLALTGVAFTDSLPAGLVVATPGNPSTTCSGGTATAADGSSTVSLSGASVAPNSSCTVTVTVQGTTAGVKSNSVQVTSTNGGTGNTANASITVVAPATISKAFNPSVSIPLNGTATLTFTINNSNLTAAGDLTGLAFSDTLPSTAGTLVVATTPNVVNNCNGTVTATAGTGVISLAGGSVTHNSSCTLSVDVKGTAAGDAANTTGAISSIEGGTGTTSNTATLKIVAPPTISKAFGAATIGLNGVTSLTFTITNPAANTVAETGVAFTDALPANLVVATPNGSVGNCNGGTLTATAGSGSVSLTGGTIPAAGSCVLSVNVTSSVSGSYNNTTGAVSSTNGGTGVSSNTANLNVAGPPTIIKAFGAPTIPLGGTTSLTLSIQNPNTGLGLTGLAFTDNLPAGLVVATPNGLSNTCNGIATAVAGSGQVSLSGGTEAASGSCTVKVNVTGTTAGVQNNTTSNVTSTEGGPGNTANASITVIAPPTILKVFGAANINLNATTSLTFTIGNPLGNATLSGIAFTDNLPAGLLVASPGNPSTTCAGGTVTAVDGASSITLSGGTLAGNASCTVSVTITGAQVGVWTNSVTVSSLNGGTGNTSLASLQVGPQPTFTKAFNPSGSIPLNTNTTLTFTIVNPVANATTLSSLAFTDALPAGLAIASTDNLTTDCNAVAGDVSVAGTVTLNKVAVPNTISLTGLSLLGGTTGCTIAVDVTGIAAGTQKNTATISSTEGGNPGPTATASIDVVAPPSMVKAFNPNIIALNATTSLTFTITNPGANNVAEAGVAFTDTLPVGLTVANGSNTNACGLANGTVTTTAATGVIALSGASIPVNSQCQFNVPVTGGTAGNYTNVSGPVTSTNGGTGNTASANLTVDAPPTISKQFGALTIPLNGATTLTFTIQNPNTTPLTGLAFTDNLPSGLQVASTPNGSSTCGSTFNPAGGAGSVSLSGGTLAASAGCTVSVDIQGTTAGVKINTTGAVTSNESGTGAASNTASITVLAPPVIIKAFGAASIPLNGTTSLAFTIQNNNTTVALSGVAFSDTLPAGLIVANPNGLSGSCGAGTITATANSNAISLSGGTIPESSQCQFQVNVTGIAGGQQNNTTGQVTSTEGGTGGTASASIKVESPPSIAKVFNPSTIALNATTSLTFTITNPAANVDNLTGVAFTDTLPTGLTVASSSFSVCNGTLTTTSTQGIGLSGATIPVNSQCQFSVTVTGATSGQYTNTTGNVTSTNGGTGNTATANLTVAAPPAITKQFGALTIPLNGTTSLTFTIQNANTSVTLTGLAFTDNLPSGLQVASTPNGSNTCGGTFNPVGGAGSVSLSGGTLATSASCTVKVDVQGTTAGVKINSVTVTSTEGGAGTPSSASITVVAPPVIIKIFGAASIAPNANPGTSLTFIIQNNSTTVALSGVGFTDTFPAGLVVSTPNGLAGNTCSTTPTAVAGSNSVSLSGASIAANTSCTFAVNVTGTTPGLKNNTTGNVTSTEGGTGGTASASVNVLTAPVIAKVFTPPGIPVNGTSIMTITITNPAANPGPLNGVAFTDSFPTNLVVATPNGLNNGCGGTAMALAGSGTVSLSGGGPIAANSSCTVAVNVTSSAVGLYTNITGPVSSTNAGTGNTATANLAVAAPPTISKAFSADKVAQNSTVFASFTITNPNSDPNPSLTLTGVGFSDTLPAGMVVATPNGLSNNCGGTVTAMPGSSSITLSGGAIDPAVPPMLPGRRRATSPRLGPSVNAAGLCVVNVNLLVTGTGTLANTTGKVSATESGLGAFSNTVVVDVVQPPTAAKAFGAASVPLNGSTSLTFTFANPNSGTTLVSTALNDNLPSGLVVANPNGVAGSCLGGGAVVVANPGASSIAISLVTLPASSSCGVSVNVTGTSAGTKNNTSGQASAQFDDGTGTFVPITGGTASASIDVVAPPSIAKAFNPVLIAPTTTSTLTFTITNPAANSVAEAGVAFTDTLPANLVVATPNGASGTCNGGTLTAVAGSGSISLTGGSIPAASNCIVSVNVTSSVPGSYTNTTGAVSSTNGGTGNTASANLTVTRAALSITKTHTDPFSRGQTGATYTITVSNTATAGPTVGTVTVVDTLPNVNNTLVATAMTGTGWTCTLGTLTCTRGDALAPGSSYPAITLTVNVPINIKANVTNSVTVSGGGDPNSHTANDPTHIGPPIQITFNNSTLTVARGQSVNDGFTLESSAGLTVTFGCSGLPSGTLCSFNPPSSSLLTDSINMNIATSGPSASSAPIFPGGPTYALLFPALGLLGLVIAGKRSKKTRLRLAMAVSGFVLLLALAGCGGRPNFNGTPPGTYTITVTATSGTTSGSATVTLNVQ
jgi:CSLREA domain-containing protein/fimbrial isopeptide formation D2 family protein